MRIAKGTIKRIHVNRQMVRQGKPKPISIQTSQGVKRAGVVQIYGPSFMVYRPDKPLKCGAKLWVETKEAIAYG